MTVEPSEKLVSDIAYKVAHIALHDSVHVDQWIATVINSAVGGATRENLEDRLAYNIAVGRRLATVVPSWPDSWQAAERDADVRVVAALLAADSEDVPEAEYAAAREALRERFADRIVALDARNCEAET